MKRKDIQREVIFNTQKNLFKKLDCDFWQHPNGFSIRHHEEEDFYELRNDISNFDGHDTFDQCIRTMIDVLNFENKNK